ncbi:MAG: hypothetical protein ACKOHI_04710 [Phycisphaerales bacterium]
MTFSARLAVAASAAASCVASSALAQSTLLSAWTFPTALPTNPPPGGVTYSYGAANEGVLTAGSMFSGTHASASTAWTTPSGNSSQYALSSNFWAIGDYYEARFSTLGYADINIGWDQTRSSTGPATFDVAISIDGGSNFSTILASYTVLQSGGGGAPGTWSTTGAYLSIYSNTLSLTNVASNQADVRVRFRATAAAGGTSGSGRIDNVLVYSGPVIPVPAPGAVALLGLAGLTARRRRR